MKSALIAFLVVVCVPTYLFAQANLGGGGVPVSRCILPEEYLAIQKQIQGTNPKFQQKNPSGAVKYFDPMGNGGINSPGKTITNYVDLDATVGLRDYNCGALTYDGHHGTDIEIQNFYDMDEGVPIICAAPGTVNYTHDGEFDRQIAWIDGAQGNAVIVHHADGSDGWYWHMRKKSVRVKVGDVVKVGDTLGFVGSSGFSSGPHLHFEVEQGKVVDPFTGTCQTDSSRWVNQTAYVLTLPFQLMDHGVTSIPLSWQMICEKPPVKTHFKSGTRVYSWFRLRNIVAGDVMRWDFYLGSTMYTSFNFPADNTYSSSWWDAYINMPVGVSYYGQWTVKVYRNGTQMLEDSFSYDNADNQLPNLNDTTITVAKGSTISGVFAGTDPDGSIFWYKIASPPKNGTLLQSGGRGRKFTYIPNSSFSGKDSLLVYAVDDENANGPNARYVFDVSTTSQGIALSDISAPRDFTLSQNYPNPFNPSTTIEFTLPEDGKASLKIYDVLGREVATLVNGELKAGVLHQATFDASKFSSGIYFSRLEFSASGGNENQLMKKILLIK